jgi:hypothetical protein
VGFVFPGVSAAGGGGEVTDGAGEVEQIRRLVRRALDRLLGEEAIGKDAADERNDQIVRSHGIAAENLVRESLEVG